MNLLPRTSRTLPMLALALVILSGTVRAEEPRLYVPLPGQPSDVNGDGVSDVDSILRKIDELARVGVKFDDEDKDGNVPMRRRDGKYHMACVDLLHIVYREAGIDIPSSMSGGRLLESTADPKKLGSGRFRQISHVVPWLRRNPNFHYYSTPEINLVGNRRWRPRTPFKTGDMIFVHYNDASDRHSGIVTGVDPATGLPTHITQVSIYNQNQGLHRASIDEFFALKCRMLSGYAHPASWEEAPIVDPTELRAPDAEVLARSPRRSRSLHGRPRRSRTRSTAITREPAQGAGLAGLMGGRWERR